MVKLSLILVVRMLGVHEPNDRLIMSIHLSVFVSGREVMRYVGRASAAAAACGCCSSVSDNRTTSLCITVLHKHICWLVNFIFVIKY